MIWKLKLKFLVAILLLDGLSHAADDYMGSSVSWRVLDHTNDDQILVKATFRKVYAFDCQDPSSWSCYQITSGSCSTLYNSKWKCTDLYFYPTSMSSVKFVQTTDDSITYRILSGFPKTLHIRTFDEDGDDITCRYGNNNLENGDVINNFSYLTLDEENCELTYIGGWNGYSVTVPVTIIVEDHPKSDSATTNSFTSLQFVVNVYNPGTIDTCEKYPTIEQPTEMQKFAVKSGEEFHLVVQAQTYYCNETEPGQFPAPRIKHIEINGAAQMRVDFVHPRNLGNGLYQTNFTWIPEADDKGENFICFTAYNVYSFNSDQRCIIINVDGSQGGGSGSIHLHLTQAIVIAFLSFIIRT